MTEEKENSGTERSWRNIRQEVTSRAMSKRGRRRQQWSWFKAVVLVALVGFSSWGIYALLHAWESDRGSLASAVNSAPVREIVVS
ncbi:MAG: hypothetical protein Q8J74_08280, partial [Candidatus Didemnitutus sp.]|nr:hypothetical protein [Candidatus Didemnitutus sp.]